MAPTYNISAFAALAGVSTRTLRYYDRIGLLHPAQVTAAGYRVYGAAEVDRLQQILFYRALEVPLADIAALLARPDFDRRTALSAHINALQARKQHLQLLIDTAQKSLAAMKGESTMTDNEKFKGFKQELINRNEAQYGNETRAAYGDAAVEAANKKLKDMPAAEFNEMQLQEEEILTRLAAAVAAGQSPDGDEGRAIATLHHRWLCHHMHACPPATHKGLAALYVQDERFTAYYDKAQPGCAAFLHDAVLALYR